MKCYCYEDESNFIFCVEGAEGRIYEKLQADQYWIKADADKLIKMYLMDTGLDDSWYLIPEDRVTIKKNFARFGQAWLAGVFDWKGVLPLLACKFKEHKVKWYIRQCQRSGHRRGYCAS